MTTDLFSRVEPSWISSADLDAANDPITLYSSVRTVRNIDGFPFPNRCSKPQLYDSAAILLGEIGSSETWMNCDFRMIDNLDALSKNLLLETRMITPLLAEGGAGRFFLRDGQGEATCMVNEENHLTLSITRPGLELLEIAESSRALLASVRVQMAYDTVLGYLTANPGSVGAGFHASVLLHLPALDALDDMKRVLFNFERDWKGLAFYKLLSDLNNASGSFYLLTNRVTLGVDQSEIVGLVTDAAQAIISKEMFARHKILNVKVDDMKDRFWRAWGLLRHARKLSFPEAVNRFSFVKLGSDLGILPRIGEREWRSTVIGAQRYHMRVLNNQITEQSDEPYIRASMFRQFIERSGANPTTGQSDPSKEL